MPSKSKYTMPHVVDAGNYITGPIGKSNRQNLFAPRKGKQDEHNVYKFLMDRLRPFMELERIESHMRCGIPDIYCAESGYTCWIEVKDCPGGMPNFLPLRKAQALWIQKMVKRGVKIWVLLRLNGTMMALFRGSVSPALAQAGAGKLALVAHSTFYDSKALDDSGRWGDFAHHLLTDPIL